MTTSSHWPSRQPCFWYTPTSRKPHARQRVFLGAAIRLLKPQLTAHPRMGLTFAVLTVVVAAARPIGLFAVLLVAGAAGAVLLRPR